MPIRPVCSGPQSSEMRPVEMIGYSMMRNEVACYCKGLKKKKKKVTHLKDI